MDDQYTLVPPPTAMDCFQEVHKLAHEASKLKDAGLVEHVSYLLPVFDCLPQTEKVLSLYFQTGELSVEDRRFLEMTYIAMYGVYVLGDDGKIVTTVIKG